METKFQTSFIPKKPLVSNQPLASVNKKRGGGMLTFISLLIFIISLAGAGFSVLWQRLLLNQQEAYANQLRESEDSFNTTLIEEIRETSAKINISTDLLKSHVAMSGLFDIIGLLVVDDVIFTGMEVTADNTSDIKIKLDGVGRNYKTIAFQSDVLGQSSLYGKNRIIKNPIISDISNSQEGGVTFTMTATVSKSDLLYENTLIK